MRKSIIAIPVLLFTLTSAHASSPTSGVYTQRVHQGMAVTVREISKSLKIHHFKIVQEIDIGKKVAMAHKLLHFKNYNLNHLSGTRAIVFCNPVLFNMVTNDDPDMAAICPLHVTLTSKGGWTTIQYARASVIAEGTPAEGAARKVEADVIAALETVK
ncbi:MAG: DUF302 domain-containing protein [Acidiferrobacterales bacterium]